MVLQILTKLEQYKLASSVEPLFWFGKVFSYVNDDVVSAAYLWNGACGKFVQNSACKFPCQFDAS